VVALLLAACSGTPGSDSAEGPGGTANTASAGDRLPLEQPRTRCRGPATEATLVRFASADGISLDGVLVGDGPAGVVLVHEYPDDLCGSWPVADYLVTPRRRSSATAAVTSSMTRPLASPPGQSESPKQRRSTANARSPRFARVALIGASMGGAAVLIAGTKVQPPVAAVVSVSGEADPTDLVGGIPLNAGAAVGQLTAPTMLIVATNDSTTSVEETRTMHRAVKNADKRLSVLSGQFDGQHGWQLLYDPTEGKPTSVAAAVAAFLTAHTRD
jgi:pimeloyl-ACP methyl ester carboxylesterase